MVPVEKEAKGELKPEALGPAHVADLWPAAGSPDLDAAQAHVKELLVKFKGTIQVGAPLLLHAPFDSTRPAWQELRSGADSEAAVVSFAEAAAGFYADLGEVYKGLGSKLAEARAAKLEAAKKKKGGPPARGAKAAPGPAKPPAKAPPKAPAKPPAKGEERPNTSSNPLDT